MRIGAIFPQLEIGADPAVIRDYAQAVEAMGFDHILVYDHVLGAHPDRFEGSFRPPYNHESIFHEPFVLFGYMAAFTSKIEFVTGILILPQRQTALVAKQAATLDVLSHGRLRLGVGLGWNEVEYVALNQDFHTRGRRIEEQVEVLRELWTKPLVSFHGRWHTIPDAGINPLPVQRPIPIWFGGHADAVLQRTARLGDGWLPNHPSPDHVQPLLQKLDEYLAQYGRNRSDIGIEPRISYGDGNPDAWRQLIGDWQALGATHLSINTMRLGFETPDDHLRAMRTFAEAIFGH